MQHKGQSVAVWPILFWLLWEYMYVDFVILLSSDQKMINWTLGHGTSLCAVWHMCPPWIADGIIDYILQYNRWNMLRVLYIHTIICVYVCFNISSDISWQDDVNPDTIYWVTRRASDHAFNAKRCIEHQHLLWALWPSVEYIGTMKRGLYIARSISFC